MRSGPGLLLLITLLGSSVRAAAAVPPTPVETALASVLAARKVMMDDPAAALAIGVDLERRAAAVPAGRDRMIMLSKAKWIAGEASQRLGRSHNARRLIEAAHALALAAHDPKSEAESLLSRGSIRSESGDPAGALQDYLSAHQLFQRTGDARSQSIALQYMSELYRSARDYPRAAHYLQQAAHTYLGEPLTQLALANNTGNLFSEQGQYPEAAEQYQRGLAISRQLRLHGLEIRLLSNLALAQISQRHLAKASATVDQIAAVASRTGTPIDNTVLATSARLALAQGNAVLARTIMAGVFARAGAAAPGLDEHVQFNAYEIFKAAGDPQAALQHLEIASRMRNEAVALGMSNKAALMAARFDYETQNLRIAALEASGLRREMALQRADVRSERKVFIAVAGFVLVLMALLTAWLVALRRSRDRIRIGNLRLEQANTALGIMYRELEARAEAERRATDLANHDALTGLPNRRQLSDDFLLDLGSRNDAGSQIYVLLLDLDRFKAVNDIHGHDTGDLVLVAAADRLRELSKPPGATAVRLGGDEFVVVMAFRNGDEAAAFAAAIVETISVPISIGDKRLTLGASIGIARYPQNGTTIGDLLRSADAAMYEAKRSGFNKWRFFDPAMTPRQRLRAA